MRLFVLGLAALSFAAIPSRAHAEHLQPAVVKQKDPARDRWFVRRAPFPALIGSVAPESERPHRAPTARLRVR